MEPENGAWRAALARISVTARSADEAEETRAALDSVGRAAQEAVDSFLGLRVTLAGPHPTVSLGSWADGDPSATPPASSLAFTLDDGAGATSRWVLYAGRPGAFVDLAADLAWLLGLPLTTLSLDQDLDGFADGVEATGDGSADSLVAASTVDQAMGFLLGRGLLPEAAGAVLDELARRLGGDRREAAEHVLAGGELPPVTDGA